MKSIEDGNSGSNSVGHRLRPNEKREGRSRMESLESLSEMLGLLLRAVQCNCSG